MAKPTVADVHTDALLSQVSVAYRNTNYIADQILPVISVNKKSDTIAKYTKADWFRDEARQRAPGAYPPEGDYGLDSAASYECINYSYAKVVADEVRENADAPIRPEIEAVEFATDKIMLSMERRVAAALFNATTFASYTATAAALTGGGGVAWSTYGTSTPLTDIDAMADLIRAQIARRPNTLVMGQTVWKTLRWHPDLLDSIKYTQTGVMTTDVLGRLVDIPRIFVGGSIYSATAEGASFSSSDIWGNYVLLCYVPDRPSLMSPGLGYIVRWGNREAQRYVLGEGRKATKFVVEEFTDEVILAADAGYLLTSVV